MTIYVVEVSRIVLTIKMKVGTSVSKKSPLSGSPRDLLPLHPVTVSNLHQCLHLIYQNLGGRLEGPSLVHDRVKVCPFLLHKTPELGWPLFW
jgi:hypothetical protein